MGVTTHIDRVEIDPSRLASGYVRLSKAAGDSNLSRDGMADDIRKLAASQGYHLTNVWIDDGLSGAIRNRPEFLAWLNDGRMGQALLTHHADRLTREGVNAAALVLDVVEGKDAETGKVVRKPVRLLDCYGTDSDGDSTAFRFKFVIAAEVARAERARIQARNSAAQRRLREQRRFRGSYAPYGYEVIPHPDGHGKGLAVNEAERQIILQAADQVLSGRTLYSVVMAMNEAGVRTHRGKTWTMQSLKGVLTGHAVLGRMSHDGQPIRGDDGLPVTPWEPIMDVQQWEQLRAILTDPARRRLAKGQKMATRILTRLLVCHGCGKAMKSNTSNGRDRYVCANKTNATGRCASAVTIGAQPLEDYIENEFLTRYGAMLYQRTIYAVEENAELAQVESAIKDLSDRIGQPDADVAAIALQIASLQEQRKTLSERPVQSVTRVVDTGQTVAEAWEAVDVVGQHDLLGEFLKGPIVVGPGTHRKGADPTRLTIPWRDKSLVEQPERTGHRWVVFPTKVGS